MTKYVVGRIVQMIPVFLIVTFLSYTITLIIPGGPIQAIVGVEPVSPEILEGMKRDLGLDKPIPVQYVVWLGRLVQGDMGRRLGSGRAPVAEEIQRRVPVTLQLALTSWFIGLSIALPAGIISAVRRNSRLDALATVFAVGGIAIPSFWLGILFVLLFGVMLRVLPVGGFVSFFDNPWEAFRHMILPAITLGIGMSASTMRQTRSSLLEVLAEDYIRTAHAKGLRETTVIGVHALKNSLLPVATIMGMHVSRLLGGAVVVEQIFAVPGMGRLAVSAMLNRDIATIQGTVVVMALMVLVSNLLTDILYGYLDPRIRYT